MNYCQYCRTLPDDNPHRIHHDTDYGIAIDDDNELFGKMILEINQAGLSWDTILKKEANFRHAYSNYEIDAIAQYSETDRERLLNDAGIIRNRLKINAIIYNSQQIQCLQKEFGSFFNWIKIQKADSREEWVKLFKKQFKFVGGEICNEFLMTTGRVDGGHTPDCYRYSIYEESRKKWF